MEQQCKEVTAQEVQQAVYVLPNRPPFMLAADLAAIYGTKRRQVLQAVRRHPNRFPADFCFKLEPPEVEQLRGKTRAGGFQNETNLYIPGASQPLAFTRFGANMLSAVLKSDIAAARSVMIMRAFSAIEEAVDSGKGEFAAGFALGLKRGLMLSELFEKHSLPMSILGAYCYHRQHGQSPAGAAGSVHISAKKAHAIELAFQNAGIRTPGTDRQPSPADARKSLTTMLSTGQPEVPNDHQ